jgi:O-antigen ligase
MNASAVLLALSAAAIALPLSIAASNAALALLTLALLLRARADGARILAAWRAEPALAAVAAYVAAGLLSAALGTGPAASLRDCLKDSHRLWSLGLLVAAVALEPEASVAPALGAGLSVAALVGIAQSCILLASGTMFRMARAHAFAHPVTYGDMMALGALGAAALFPRAADARERRGAIAVGCLCAAATALSQTRAALLALAVGAAVAAVLEPRLRRVASWMLGLGALAAAAAELLRFGRAAFGAEFGASNAAPGQDTRFTLWKIAWRMFRDRPWTGVGPGHYLTEFRRYHPDMLYGQAEWTTAHNVFVHQLAERGLVGEVALLVLFAVLLARAWRAARVRRDAASLWAAAAVPAFLVMNLTETAWQTEQLATLFLLVWALGAARRGRAEIL